MKPTPIQEKEDAALVRKLFSRVKAERMAEKKVVEDYKNELAAGLQIQADYYAGRNSPRDVPQIRKNKAWADEQLQSEKPFGYYDREQRKQNVIVVLVAVVVVAAISYFGYLIYF